MYCVNCGKEVESSASFCPHCGTPINSMPAAPQSQQQRQPHPQPQMQQTQPLQGCPKCGSSNVSVISEEEKGKYWWGWLIAAVIAFVFIVRFLQAGVSSKATHAIGYLLIIAVVLAVVSIVQRVKKSVVIKAKCNQCGKEYEFKKANGS